MFHIITIAYNGQRHGALPDKRQPPFRVIQNYLKFTKFRVLPRIAMTYTDMLCVVVLLTNYQSEIVSKPDV